jgi:hypothetical protein
VFFCITIELPGTRNDKAGLVYWYEYILPHIFRLDLLCLQHVKQTQLKTGLLFAPFVDFQNSLFHTIRCFVGFPVLVHALTHMEQTRLLAVPYPHAIFSFVDGEINPAVQAFCKYPAGFRR